MRALQTDVQQVEPAFFRISSIVIQILILSRPSALVAVVTWIIRLNWKVAFLIRKSKAGW